MTGTAAGLAGRDRYEAQVRAALGAVDVRPPATFLWFGRRVCAPAPGVRASVDEALAREVLVEGIQRRLLADFYPGGAPCPLRGGPATAPDGSEFVRALSQANCGRGSWQSGWGVAGTDSDGGGNGDTLVVVRRDGLRLVAPAEACRAGDGAPSGGTRADVLVPKELRGFSPGFYVALGDTPCPASGGDDLVRLCWNIAAAGAVTLVARVTYALNGAGLPFSLELLDNPARYRRRTAAAALLLTRTDFAPAVKLLRPLLRALGPHLADGVPAFTKPLGRGLNLAEEPADGRSFGDHRCQLLAEAIVTASEHGLRPTDQRLAVVRDRFRDAGLTLDAPYLDPGSEDGYALT